MTSAINYSAINIAYPVAGIDNDSQGFRDNFSATANALSVAKTEITALQTNSVDVTKTTNDLLGSTISNGLLKNMSGASYGSITVTSGSTVDITISNGPLQIFALSGNATLRFTGWPTSGKYANIRVHIRTTGTVAVPAGPFTPTLGTANGGTMVYATGFPSLALGNTGKYKVIEAWTFDNGTNVYVQYLGEY